MRNDILKRTIDLASCFFVLVICAPIWIVLIFGIRIIIGSPIIFRQQRPGRDGRLFEMVKFRTMLNTRDADGELLSDELRLTRFGKFLRSTSLDELPEFWNVLKGEMSLVGPRPLLSQYLTLYDQRQQRRHDVRPGITGWAQINGRNTTDWDKRLEMDVWYVENQSFWLDLKIIALTIVKVIKRDDISEPGHVTKEFFKGN